MLERPGRAAAVEPGRFRDGSDLLTASKIVFPGAVESLESFWDSGRGNPQLSKLNAGQGSLANAMMALANRPIYVRATVELDGNQVGESTSQYLANQLAAA